MDSPLHRHRENENPGSLMIIILQKPSTYLAARSERTAVTCPPPRRVWRSVMSRPPPVRRPRRLRRRPRRAAVPVEAAEWPVAGTAQWPAGRARATVCTCGTASTNGCRPSRRPRRRHRTWSDRRPGLRTRRLPASRPPHPWPHPPPRRRRRPRPGAPAVTVPVAGARVATGVAKSADVCATFSASVCASPTTAARPSDRPASSWSGSLCPAAWPVCGSGRSWMSTRPGSPSSLFASPAPQNQTNHYDSDRLASKVSGRRGEGHTRVGRAISRLFVSCIPVFLKL